MVYMDQYAPYKIIEYGGTGEIVEKKSRFIADVQAVSSEEEAIGFIEAIKKRYWDARHHCYAYVLGEQGQTLRFSDDGEPSGTAGRPILEVLTGFGIRNLVLVVTRYFGGILLVAGGLVRAYSHGAKLAVDAAERMTVSECTELALEFGYDLYGKISYILPKYHARTTFSDFGAVVRLQILLRDCDLPPFEKELTELTAAQVVPQAIEKRFACIEG